jgi:formate hydrogenlyase transcriptional activator
MPLMNNRLVAKLTRQGKHVMKSRYNMECLSSIAESPHSVDVLKTRLEFETLISDASEALLTAPIEDSIVAAERALERLRLFFHADRCGLASVGADRQVMNVALATYAQGVPHWSAHTNLAELFPWSVQRLLVENKPVFFSGIADLPPEAEADRKSWIQVPARSALMVPIQSSGVVSHLIILSSVHHEREWPEALLTRVRALGGMLVSALERQVTFAGLRGAEERMNLAAESAEAGLWSLDYRTGVHWGTPRALAIFGFLPEEVVNIERFVVSVHPDDRDLVRSSIQRSRHERGPLSVEYRIVRPDGEVRWVASRGRVSFAPSGEPETLTGVTIDITQRRQAEEALRESYSEIERLKDRLQAEGEYLKAEMSVIQSHEVIGQSSAIQKLLRLVEQVAPTDASVLLLGETGSGKELIARAIHRQSPRRNHLMITVNCAALPSALVESELFGRERGAYTGAMSRQVGRFEIADGSTIFLDEVGELSLDVQAKLLRVLETGEFERLGSPKTIKVNVRVIAATNRDLREAIQQGKLREDLFYRLNVFPIKVPPLRDRPEDIPLLVWRFLDELSARMGKRFTQVSRKTMEALQRHPWPGNVRELRNVIEHGAIISPGATLRIPTLNDDGSIISPRQSLAEAERYHILETLKRTLWKVKGPKGAAAQLKLNPSTLYSRMKKLGIRPHRRSGGGKGRSTS